MHFNVICGQFMLSGSLSVSLGLSFLNRALNSNKNKIKTKIKLYFVFEIPEYTEYTENIPKSVLN